MYTCAMDYQPIPIWLYVYVLFLWNSIKPQLYTTDVCSVYIYIYNITRVRLARDNNKYIDIILIIYYIIILCALNIIYVQARVRPCPRKARRRGPPGRENNDIIIYTYMTLRIMCERTAFPFWTQNRRRPLWRKNYHYLLLLSLSLFYRRTKLYAGLTVHCFGI